MYTILVIDINNANDESHYYKMNSYSKKTECECIDFIKHKYDDYIKRKIKSLYMNHLVTYDIGFVIIKNGCTIFFSHTLECNDIESPDDYCPDANISYVIKNYVEFSITKFMYTVKLFNQQKNNNTKKGSQIALKLRENKKTENELNELKRLLEKYPNYKKD